MLTDTHPVLIDFLCYALGRLLENVQNLYSVIRNDPGASAALIDAVGRLIGLIIEVLRNLGR